MLHEARWNAGPKKFPKNSPSAHHRFFELYIFAKRVSRLGSVTARHSSSGRQPKFAALNRGRHLHSAGRPSRWALDHILVNFLKCVVTEVVLFSIVAFKTFEICRGASNYRIISAASGKKFAILW